MLIHIMETSAPQEIATKFNWRGTELTAANAPEFCNRADQYRFILTKDGHFFIGSSKTTYHEDLVKMAGLDLDSLGSEVVDAGFLDTSVGSTFVMVQEYSTFLENHGIGKSKQLSHRERTVEQLKKLLPQDVQAIKL